MTSKTTISARLKNQLLDAIAAESRIPRDQLRDDVFGLLRIVAGGPDNWTGWSTSDGHDHLVIHSGPWAGEYTTETQPSDGGTPAPTSGGHPSFGRHPRGGRGNEIMGLRQRIARCERDIEQAQKSKTNAPHCARMGKQARIDALAHEIEGYRAQIARLQA